MPSLALLLLLSPAVAKPDLHYTLSPMPTTKAIAVSIREDNPESTEVYSIPAWCPGFYFLLKYQDKVFDVAASGSNGQLKVDKTGDRQWTVQNPNKEPVTFSYKVQGDDPGLGFFGVSVRDDKAFVNGAGGFMYREGHLTDPVDLQIKVPTGWDIATGMDKDVDGIWHANGYDEFIDMPIQMGVMKHTSFKVGDYDFDVAWVSQSGEYRPDLKAQTEVLRKVSAAAIELFHGAPFKRYQYILHLTSQGFLGGLEHRASTDIALPNQTGLDVSTIAAHEFFHTWNVKNIRPKILGPFDYTKEQRTPNLWFAEGVTDYYAQLNCYRAGLYDVHWLYDVLSAQVGQLQASPTRLKISLDDACRATWENGGFGYKDLDYYNKGLLCGLVFDASIRNATAGVKSLDDVMRLMYAKYRLPNPGYDDDGIRNSINEIAGRDLGPIYDQCARSVKELPYHTLSGIGLRVVAPRSMFVDAGFTTWNNQVVDVRGDTVKSGLKNGDIVVGTTQVGTYRMTLKIRRAEQSLLIQIPLTQVLATKYVVEEDPLSLPAARSALSSWLSR